MRGEKREYIIYIIFTCNKKAEPPSGISRALVRTHLARPQLITLPVAAQPLTVAEFHLTSALSTCSKKAYGSDEKRRLKTGRNLCENMLRPNRAGPTTEEGFDSMNISGFFAL